jgi:yersiniabactin nonribosomal peptide synthetase
MIPSTFRFITLPLTAAGELDLGLLNEMLDLDEERGDVIQEQRTPMQHILAVIIREVFQREPDDMEEALFHQAQDHARMEELIARIRDVVDQELTVEHLLERPTIATLAAYLESLQP